MCFAPAVSLRNLCTFLASLWPWAYIINAQPPKRSMQLCSCAGGFSFFSKLVHPCFGKNQIASLTLAHGARYFFVMQNFHKKVFSVLWDSYALSFLFKFFLGFGDVFKYMSIISLTIYNCFKLNVGKSLKCKSIYKTAVH